MKKYYTVIALIVLCTLTVCAQDNRKDTEKQEQGNNMKNVLVAYFSVTGNTCSIAEQISKITNADLYEIKPQIPYSTADLNWRNNSSRATMEQNDPSSRPAISGIVENMGQYDIIFLGYPIWFAQAPRIISTFLESYDFSGKKIVPFCTSGSSPIGSSASNLSGLCSDKTIWISGTRFASKTSRLEIERWINGLGIKL